LSVNERKIRRRALTYILMAPTRTGSKSSGRMKYCRSSRVAALAKLERLHSKESGGNDTVTKFILKDVEKSIRLY
jgi:hypothetical protein